MHAGLRELPSIVRVQRTTSGCPDKATSFSRRGREGCSARVAHRRRRNDYGGGGAPRSICLHLTAQQRRCRAPHLPWKSAYQLRTHGEGGYPGGGTQWNVFHPPHSRRAAIVREGLGSVVTTRTDHRKTEGNAITPIQFSYLSTLRSGRTTPTLGICPKVERKSKSFLSEASNDWRRAGAVCGQMCRDRPHPPRLIGKTAAVAWVYKSSDRLHSEVIPLGEEVLILIDPNYLAQSHCPQRSVTCVWVLGFFQDV